MPQQPDERQQWASFGAYVASVRAERGYSVRELGKRAGLAPSTVKRTEDGYNQHPTPDVFLALVDALSLDLSTSVELVEPYRRLWQRFTAAHDHNRHKHE